MGINGLRALMLPIRTILATLVAAVAACALPGAAFAAGLDEPPPTCDRVLPETVESLVSEEVVQVTSAGGAVITGSLLMPDEATTSAPAAAILMTHGGGSSRRSLAPVPGNLTHGLLDAGFAVLTFDTRGHGDSRRDVNGNATVLYDFAGRDGVEDVRALVRLLGRCRAIRQEAAGDPVVGLVGVSNGAGIQLNAAAAEPAIDAIVPTLSWSELHEDFAPNGVPKTYAELVYQNLADARVQIDPVLTRWHEAAVGSGTLTQEARDWLAERSTSANAERIGAATLLLQGTVDGLFPPEGAIRNYERIRRGGAPVKLVVFCSAHDAQAVPKLTCRAGADMTRITFAWLNKHLRGADADTGAPIDWYGPDRRFRSADDVPANSTVVALPASSRRPKARGRSRGNRRRTARPRHRAQPRRPLGTLEGPGGTGGDTQTYASPAPDSEGRSTLRLRLLDRNRRGCRTLFGIPRLTVQGTLEGAEGFLFAELQQSNLQGQRGTVNLNTMPVRIAERRFAATFDLHATTWLIGLGNHLDLELTTGSAMYLEPSRRFKLTIDRVVARLPVGPVGRARRC